MNLVSNLDFMDFYFNGHWLSEFGGMIGGKEGLSDYPLLPSRVYTTDRAIKQDGVTVFDSYLEPRVFEVPIVFEDIDYKGLRAISGWLNSKTDQWFYYKDDTLKIRCALDNSANDIEFLGFSNGKRGGETSLKFIAHDPYYYELDETIYDYKNLTNTTNTYNLTNTGNEFSFPVFSIWGTGTIAIKLYDADNFLISTCTVSNLTTGFVLDSKSRTCYTQSGAPHFNSFEGRYPLFPVGNYKVEVIGSATDIKITPRYRFV